MNKDYLETYYNQEWVYESIREFFSISELVSPGVEHKYGVDQSWSFLDPRLLANLLFIRKGIGLSMTINNGGAQQRGLRENTSAIVKGRTDKGKIYLSSHCLGNAVDITVSGMDAEDVRRWILNHSEELPYKCRLEHMKDGVPISWVHMDCAFFENYPKVYLFDV